MSLKIILATKNRGKIEEIKYILKESGIADAIEIHSLSDFPDIPEIIEDGTTFSENARKKAEAVAAFTGLTAIADDSGLEVDALNGVPGIYSARFAGENATDSENIQKLLKLLKGVPEEKRGARFVCVIAIATHGENVILMEGQCRGFIAMEERGTSGFGYDPVFIVPEYGKTFAELGAEIKNKISHRAVALSQLKTQLKLMI